MSSIILRTRFMAVEPARKHSSAAQKILDVGLKGAFVRAPAKVFRLTDNLTSSVVPMIMSVLLAYVITCG